MYAENAASPGPATIQSVNRAMACPRLPSFVSDSDSQQLSMLKDSLFGDVEIGDGPGNYCRADTCCETHQKPADKHCRRVLSPVLRQHAA